MPDNMLTIEREILNSEEHFDQSSMQGAIEAKKYLEELLNYPDKGLLEHEIIISVNNKLLQNEKLCAYCTNQRMTTYQGQEIWYCDPADIHSRVQIIVDRFNHKCTYCCQVLEALAEFVLSFLGVHPFSNANGRTIKFLIWYVLKSFYQVKTFYTISYSTWCSRVYQKSQDSLLDWFQTMIY